MKNIKTLLSICLAVSLCFASNMSVFAASNYENNFSSADEIMPVNSESDSGIMPLSSVSGYAQKTITSSDNSILVKCNGSGWGGMGITVKTTCSSGSYAIKVLGEPFSGRGSSISATSMTTQSEKQWHNLSQMDLAYYLITFDVPSGTPSFLAQVWIYG